MSTLVTPSVLHRDAFLRMAQEWRDHGSERYDLALDDFPAYLARAARMADPEQTPRGRVPQAEYWLESDGEIVACARLRFALTPALEVEGGHIGYDVRPRSRGLGFGKAVLRLALDEASHRGLLRVRLTVDADNAASIRVIESNGGVLSGEVVSHESAKLIRQYWIERG